MMINLGKKSDLTTVEAPKQTNRIYYPSFYIDKEIPLDKNVGDEVTAICKLKLVSISQRENEDGNKYSCSFDVLEIDFAPKKKSHYKR